jgi:glucose/arabinose dehydrogenase
MAFHDGYLYVGNTGSIVRYKYTTGDLKAQDAPEKLLDLPTGGHSTRNIVFNRAGTKMYVTVGSQSNNNAGEDCRRAAVLEFNPDGTRLSGVCVRDSQSRGTDVAARVDTLWVAVNERDNLGDDLVPDYATSIKDGGFYGWPYSYIGQHPDPRYVGAFPDLVKRALVPDVLIPAHSAALGIAFYTGTLFPQRYHNGGFVALHGSMEPLDGGRLQSGVLPDDQRQARAARRLHDGVSRQGRRRRHASRAMGTPGGRHSGRDGGC